MTGERNDVLNLVDSDDEEIFQDAVPRLPVLPNGHSTTLVEIHRIPSSKSRLLVSHKLIIINIQYMYCCLHMPHQDQRLCGHSFIHWIVFNPQMIMKTKTTHRDLKKAHKNHVKTHKDL